MNVKAKLLAALAAMALGLAALPAVADDDGWKRHHRGHHKHWKHDRHHGHHFSHGHVVRERVIVRRPVYVERPIYVERPVYYEPYVHYAPIRRHPGVVVTVDLPPLVFPLR